MNGWLEAGEGKTGRMFRNLRYQDDGPISRDVPVSAPRWSIRTEEFSSFHRLIVRYVCAPGRLE